MKGLLRSVIGNTIISNVIMFTIFGLGLFAVTRLRREMFPNLSLDRVQVQVVRRGATPEDVDDGISRKVEEALQGVEGIKQLDSISKEGVSIVQAEIDPDVIEIDKAVNNIRTEVDRLELPEDAEKPVVTEVKVLNLVNQVVIYGDIEEGDLKRLAEEVENELLALDDVNNIVVGGVRPAELSIEISDRDLLQYGLRLDDIVRRIQAESLNLPAGSIRAEQGEILIRTESTRKTAREFEDILVLARQDGTRVTLGQIATVKDAFEEKDERGRYDGQRAVFLTVFKAEQDDVVRISEAVKKYIDHKSKDLPPGVKMEVTIDLAKVVTDRIQLLLDNGWQGMVLIFFTLWLFMDIRLAWWVAWGVPTAVCGTLFVLFVYSGTLDLSATFAFILALGLLDDAIVVSENIFVKWKQGMHPVEAAVEGTSQVIVPVLAASITTCVAFAPLFFVEGTLGRLFTVIPVVVIGSMCVSLLEALLILPSHLGHGFPTKANQKGRFTFIREAIDGATDFVIMKMYTPVLALALKYRAATMGIALSSVLVAMGMMAGGHVKFTVFPASDSDFIKVDFQLPPGTPIGKTEAVAKRIEDAARKVNEKYGREIVQGEATLVGTTSSLFTDKSSNLGEVALMLMPAEERGLSSATIIADWREFVGEVPGVERMLFGVHLVKPEEKPFEILLVGENPQQLSKAKDALKAELASFEGLVDIQDDDQLGKVEYRVVLKPEARTLGITAALLANQLRQGFFGEKTVTIQRGRDTIDVVVRFPEQDRKSIADLDAIRIRTPTGEEIPLSIVADLEPGRSAARIRRVDRQRTVTVTAEIELDKANAEEVTTLLEQEFLSKIPENFPGVQHKLQGQRKQANETLGSLTRGMGVALMIIYMILIVTYRSTIQPFMIMAAIPYTALGIVGGHWIMGYDLTMMSMGGMVCLCGIVINDSIVFVEFINEALSRGMPLEEALLKSGGDRFRPNISSSLTTVIGVFPMVFETSVQAAFLIPMAIAVACGMLFATGMTLFAIPALFGLINEGRRAWFWIWKGRWPTAEEVEPAVIRTKHQEEKESGAADEVPLPETLLAAPEPRRTTKQTRPHQKPAVVIEDPHARIPALAGIGQTAILKRFRGTDDLLAEAARLAEEDDVEGALSHYHAALRRDPNRADIHSMVGMLRTRTGDWTGAAVSFDQAARLDPDAPDYLEYRAFAHLRGGNYEGARLDFSKILESDPDSLLSLQARASALIGLNRLEEALEDLDHAIQLAPKNANICYMRGDVHRRMGKHRQAIEDFDRTLERQPDHVRALLARGVSRGESGERQAAIADFDRVLELDPEVSEALERRARVWFDLKEYARSEADLSTVLVQSPGRFDLYFQRGQARACLGNRSGATSDFRIYLEHFPRSKQRRAIERYLDEQAAA